jgi:hypothetical protein
MPKKQLDYVVSSGNVFADNMHLTPLCTRVHNGVMAWEVEFTDEFFVWWDGLDADEQDNVNLGVRLLQ